MAVAKEPFEELAGLPQKVEVTWVRKQERVALLVWVAEKSVLVKGVVALGQLVPARLGSAVDPLLS